MLLVILSFTQSIQMVHAAKDEWNQLADLPTARVGAVANAVDGKIYVIGGFNADKETLEYDPSINKWTKKIIYQLEEGSSISSSRFKNLCPCWKTYGFYL